MCVFPSHDALQDSVELGECGIACHLDPQPDGRVRVAEHHLDLVNLNGFVCSHWRGHCEVTL